MRNFFIGVMLILFTGCTNLKNFFNTDTKSEVTFIQKIYLENLIDELKSELKKGNVEKLHSVLDVGLKKYWLEDELEDIDFSGITIFTTKPEFEGNKAKNMIAFSFDGITQYFNINYKLKNGEWKIIKFEERKE